MKFIPLVWAGILRKRSRSILILLQVVVAFALYGVLQGLTSGINHAIAATHADRLYVGSKLDLGDPLPVSMLEWLKTVPGVLGVAPRYQFGATYQRPEQGVPICATDVDASWRSTRRTRSIPRSSAQCGKSRMAPSWESERCTSTGGRSASG